MVKLSTLQPAQIAAEVMAYPTNLILRRWADLDTLKHLFFKKAETLGTDGGDTGYSVTHTNEASGEPLYTRLTTPATSNYSAYSWGFHRIARNSALPEGGLATTLIFEARVRLEQTANCILKVGICDPVNAEPLNPCAQINYASSVGANFYGRSYQTAEEQTDLGVAADTSWHRLHIEVESAAVRFYIDGSLKATHTTQIPDAGLVTGTNYATVQVYTAEAVAKSMRCAYVAVWLE